MPPPIQKPCRVCACWAEADVARTAARSAQKPVALSVPMSPLKVGEMCRARRGSAARCRCRAVAGVEARCRPFRRCGKLLKGKHFRDEPSEASLRFALDPAAYGIHENETGAAPAAPVALELAS